MFPSKITKATLPPYRGSRTRVITSGVQPSLHVEYKHCHVKQGFKEQHALRTETTINDAGDFRENKLLDNFPRLRTIGDEPNAKLLEVERISPNCVLDQDELDALQSPTQHHCQRAPALRFTDVRVMALMAVLCLFLLAPRGFRNRDLRAHVAALLGVGLNDSSAGSMTYDLRRLRLKGLINRSPGTNRYTLTPHGLRAAYFYTRIYVRILRPGWAAFIEPPDTVPRPLRDAVRRLDREIRNLCDDAQLGRAA